MSEAETTIERRTATGRQTGFETEQVHVLRQVFPATADGDRILDRAPLIIGRSAGPHGWSLDGHSVSRRHACIEFDPVAGRHRVRDLDSRNGTCVDGVRVVSAELVDGSVVRLGSVLLVYVSCPLPRGWPLPRLDPQTSLALALVEARVDRVADSELPVLIHGETGAGKERLARRVHGRSRRPGAFVPVNCGALAGDLLASELFGHVRGAFSGAERGRAGLMKSADRGTLFLDEIAELPLARQPALLRVLQEKRVRPVGADREVPVDLRVVSATHIDLIAAVERGAFRQDLFARLQGVTVNLPPLRGRRDAILSLFSSFVGGRPLDLKAAEALLRYDWPQNVRELEHAAAQAALFARGAERIELGHLPERLYRPASTAPSKPAPPVTAPPAPERGTRRRVRRPPRATFEGLLRTHRGNLTHVAEALGVQRNQVYRWLDKFGLDAEHFRDG